jgi:hypothetical protein
MSGEVLASNELKQGDALSPLLLIFLKINLSLSMSTDGLSLKMRAQRSLATSYKHTQRYIQKESTSLSRE